MVPNKKSTNKSMGEELCRDVNEFIKVSKIFFEYLSSLSSNTALQQPFHMQFLQQLQSQPQSKQQQQILQQQQQQQLQHINQNEQQLSNIATPQSVLQIMNYLIEVDKDYQKTLKKLEKHQKYQTEITNIQKEIEEKDKLISGLALNLKDIESFLENELSQDNAKVNPNVSNASDILDLNDTSTTTDNIINREVTPEELISYAHKISGTTFAPSGYQPHIPLTALFKPPAPQDDMMRASVLFTKPPANLLKYYGLAEQDVTTPIAAQSPIAITESATPSTKETESQINENEAFNQQQQQQQTISIPQQQQILFPPQQLNIDLDLNPDLDSDEDEEDDESGEEIEWE